MGVSGSGKTTVGRRLARRLGWEFLDADGFHPPANVRKMSSGRPLTDQDRRPWLERLAGLIQEAIEGQRRPFVLACSALRASYRDILGGGGQRRVCWVFLHGDPQLLQQRLEERSGHFMPAGLLESQLETLEPPEDALEADVADPPEQIVDSLLQRIGERPCED